MFSLICLLLESNVVLQITTLCFYAARAPAPLMKKCFYIVTACGADSYLLFVNWTGQTVIDYSGDVFESAYASTWYMASLEESRCLILIMQRSLNPFVLTAGKIMNLSMESLAKLNKACMSYFTALLSIE